MLFPVFSARGETPASEVRNAREAKNAREVRNIREVRNTREARNAHVSRLDSSEDSLFAFFP